MKVYAVIMYRWGEKDKHSYMLGVYSKKENAIKAADEEENYRGIKYTAEILEIIIDETKKHTKIKSLEMEVTE